MDRKTIGILFLVGLGMLGFWFFARKTGVPALGQPLRLQPAGSLNGQTGLLHYKNKETRNVEWNEDMVPIKIVIEREYYQLP